LIVDNSHNLKGIAWDIFTTNFGRGVAIQRLDFIRDAYGHPTYPNDIFATDSAAREFVEVMAELGDEECQKAIETVRQFEEDALQLPLP
jgi:hypothetical protein